jgi:hypothetical protein
MSPRQFVPPVFVLSLILSGLLVMFTVFRPTSSVALSAFLFPLTPALLPPSFILQSLSLVVLLMYLTVNLFASFWTASKRGWGHFSLLPLIFGILHLSYGLGFLAGLTNFWDRWGDKTGQVSVWSSGTAE